MASSSSCGYLLRLASIRPCSNHQRQTFRKPAPLLSSPIRSSCSFPNPLQITPKYNHQFLSPKILRNPSLFTSSTISTVCKTAALYEYTTSSKITPKILATEVLSLIFVYIIPLLNRLNLLSKFPVLRLAMNPVLPVLRFYQSIPTIGLIAFLALFIGFVRYRWNFRKPHSLQVMFMDSLVVIASLIRPLLVNPDPLAGGALGFKFQLLKVLQLLSFQTCVLTCLKYLEAIPWPVSCPSIKTLASIMEVVLKTDGSEGRHEGKSMVVRLLREKDSLLTDVNYSETCNKIILSSCRSCLDSLLKLFKRAAYVGYFPGFCNECLDKQISIEADNLLWLLDILVDRQVAEEFALMWANQQKLAELHKKFWTPSRRLISCISSRLFICVGNGEILPSDDTRQLLLLTWFQPLVDDYSCLQKLTSFNSKVVEENIERTILGLALEDQQRILLAWLERVLKKGDACPNLQNAFEGWCRRTFSKRPSLSIN